MHQKLLDVVALKPSEVTDVPGRDCLAANNWTLEEHAITLMHPTRCAVPKPIVSWKFALEVQP